jgi:hypothetical protein
LGGGIFSSEEGAIGGSPKQAEIVIHSVSVSLHGLHRKSPFGLSLYLFYQDFIKLYWQSIRSLPYSQLGKERSVVNA